MAADNKSLGEFEIQGIPPAPRGLPQIEVAFDIDANGIFTVSAKDKTTGKEQQITIRSSDELSESEIEKMYREAEIHAQKDQERKVLIDIKNNADTTLYSVERSLSEYKDKIPVDLVAEIETAVADLRKVSASDDVDEINSMIRVANRALSMIGVHMCGGEYRNYDPEPPTRKEYYDPQPPSDREFRMLDTRMVREAEKHAQKDQERKAVIDIKKNADTRAYIVEKYLSECKDKIPAHKVAEIETVMADLRKVSADDDVDKINLIIKVSNRAISMLHMLHTRMVIEAELKDRERKALIDIKNNADTTAYSVEKCLSEYKDKIPAHMVAEIETAVADLRKVSAGDDVNEINIMIRVAKWAVSTLMNMMMFREAEKRARKEQERKYVIDVKNNADTTVYSVEMILSEYKDKIPVDLRTRIETAVADLRKVSAGDDLREINVMIRVAKKAVSMIRMHVSGGEYYFSETPTVKEFQRLNKRRLGSK